AVLFQYHYTNTSLSSSRTYVLVLFVSIATTTLVVTSFSFKCSFHIRQVHSFPTRRSSDLAQLGWRAGSDMKDQSREHAAGLILRSEEHTSEFQSRGHLVCRLLLEIKEITPVPAIAPVSPSLPVFSTHIDSLAASPV